MNARQKLLDDLHYYQALIRIDMQSLRLGMKRCRQIGKELRALKREKKADANRTRRTRPRIDRRMDKE
jgi:hypothetical protein